jgi:amino acid adenylation domain-containing protein
MHDYPRDRCVHELFDEQAARTPDAVAVELDGQQLTYRELAARSNQLAHWLRADGMQHQDRVGLALDRSLELVIAVLGVMKAGGTYVPLDPRYPAARRELMLEKSGATRVLTNARLEAERNRIALYPTTPLMTARPDDLVYVIFTSGSTGTPKGVAIRHRGLTKHALAMRAPYLLQPGDRVLQFFSFCFDGAAEDIFPTLLAGATVVLHRDPTSLAPQAMAALCDRLRITMVDLPAAYWHALCEELAGSGPLFRSLRVLAVSGEAPSPRAVRAFAELTNQQCRFVNTYGPTEATITSTVCVLEGPEAARVDDQPIPIGVPIANTPVYLLDGNLQPADEGEIYIGGDGVGAGYLGEPALTAERFVADPFAPGALLYRTGDRGRRRADGNLEFLGRIDQQVKIRGHRVEPGEIEHALLRHPAVAACAVVVQSLASGDRRLVAHVVPRDPVDAGELRRFLVEQLPEPMVPAVFSLQPSLPLSPNGKIDRKALSSAPAAAATTPTEAELVRMWEELLELSPVGTDDDFFELGGHSLVAARLLCRIHARFGRELALSTLLSAPTIAELARLVDRPASIAVSSLVPIQPLGSKPPFFCVHGVGGVVLELVHLARLLGTDRPFYALQAAGLAGECAPFDRIEDMAAHYAGLVAQAAPTGPVVLGGYSTGGLIALEMAQHLRAQGREVPLVILLDTEAPHDRSDQADLAPLVDYLGDVFPNLRAEWKGQLDNFGSIEAALEFLLPRLAGDNPGKDIESALRVVAIAQRNLAAERLYHPRPFAGRVLVLRAAESAATDPALGWNAHVTGGVESREVPGDHTSIVRLPHVETLAKVIHERLA